MLILQFHDDIIKFYPSGIGVKCQRTCNVFVATLALLFLVHVWNLYCDFHMRNFHLRIWLKLEIAWIIEGSAYRSTC